MLAAYYSRGCDSADLFRGFKIEQNETFREHLNQYDVIFLNMQQFLIEAASGKATEYLEQKVLEELNEEYGDILKGREMGLAESMPRGHLEQWGNRAKGVPESRVIYGLEIPGAQRRNSR